MAKIMQGRLLGSLIGESANQWFASNKLARLRSKQQFVSCGKATNYALTCRNYSGEYLTPNLHHYSESCCHRFTVSRDSEVASSEPHNGDRYNSQLGEERWR